ncbi:MAG: DNA-binding response regulator [Sneathiellales bacterium]|nr:DNA-binding response regulator [Sneathiellales bacterium]
MNRTADQKATILVVDDSPDTLSMVTTALEDLGVKLLVALDGESALQITERVTPDVVLMDCVMPGMDGFQTCETIKQNPVYKHTPVIFMTGLSDTDHIVKGFSSGGIDYLTKPIIPAELIARMKVHLSNARQTRNVQSALDNSRRHIIATNAGGEILWATPEATHLLSKTKKQASSGVDCLPGQLLVWLKAYVDHQGTTVPEFDFFIEDEIHILISFKGKDANDEYLFRISEINEVKDQEILKEHFSLTDREAEVLFWIANGKSNKDIGEILEISPRTINKHLQLIFTKLGIENRTSAATMVMKVLWDA